MAKSTPVSYENTWAPHLSINLLNLQSAHRGVIYWVDTHEIHVGVSVKTAKRHLKNAAACYVSVIHATLTL